MTLNWGWAQDLYTRPERGVGSVKSCESRSFGNPNVPNATLQRPLVKRQPGGVGQPQHKSVVSNPTNRASSETFQPRLFFNPNPHQQNPHHILHLRQTPHIQFLPGHASNPTNLPRVCTIQIAASSPYSVCRHVFTDSIRHSQTSDVKRQDAFRHHHPNNGEVSKV